MNGFTALRIIFRSGMATAAELRQLLKEDANGQNLYDHLTQTLMRILVERPKNAYESFELISANVKSTPLNTDPDQGKSFPPDSEQLEHQLNWTKRCAAMLKVQDRYEVFSTLLT